MKYRKASYNILVRTDGNHKVLKPVDGYIFPYKGLRFGVTNRNIDGTTSKGWLVTELTTGMIADNTSKRTRKETVEEFEKNSETLWKTMTDLVNRFLSQTTDSNPQIIFDNAKTPVTPVERHSQTFKKGNLDIRHI